MTDNKEAGLIQLKSKANERKLNPNLRHEATPEQIKLYSENCDDLEKSQMEAIFEDYPTPKERLRQALIDVKLIQKGKLSKKTLKQLREEMSNE